MQRRLLVFPFNTCFVDNPTLPEHRQRDRDLPNKLAKEAPGILAWLVKGTIAWLEQGLNIPAICVIETETYRKSQDTVQQYIEDNLVRGEGLEVTARDLYEDYVQWCYANGQKPLSKKLLGQKISADYGKSIAKWIGSATSKVYEGIGLVSKNPIPYSLPICVEN